MSADSSASSADSAHMMTQQGVADKARKKRGPWVFSNHLLHTHSTAPKGYSYSPQTMQTQTHIRFHSSQRPLALTAVVGGRGRVIEG